MLHSDGLLGKSNVVFLLSGGDDERIFSLSFSVNVPLLVSFRVNVPLLVSFLYFSTSQLARLMYASHSVSMSFIISARCVWRRRSIIALAANTLSCKRSGILFDHKTHINTNPVQFFCCKVTCFHVPWKYPYQLTSKFKTISTVGHLTVRVNRP